MKKLIWTFCLIVGISSLAYAAGSFCCSDGKTKEQCCADYGKLYCPNDNSCRTRCKCEPDECCGCINPEGVCCDWCPTAEVCSYKGLCQKIVDGCYICAECDETCPSPKCLNQEGKCCDKCPRICPAGQCLVSVDGCYECGECGDDDDGPDDDCDPPCDEDKCETCKNGICVSKCDAEDCEACVEGKCKDQTKKVQTGLCCDEGEEDCCPLTAETCECIPDASCDTETTEPEDKCKNPDGTPKPKYKDCKECDPNTGEYTIDIACPECQECKTIADGGTGQCEAIVYTDEEAVSKKNQADEKLKGEGYIYEDPQVCDHTQESLFKSYISAGYCASGGRYAACADMAPVVGCSNLVRSDKPSFSQRDTVCPARAGYNGWLTQGLNGAKSQISAQLWGSGEYLSMGEMYSSQICSRLETDYNNFGASRVDYCCPYEERVACSSSNGISQCCRYAAELPDGKTATCGIESKYICCPAAQMRATEVGEGTGIYVCCDEGKTATEVKGGNEGEYTCCAEGETAWKNRYQERQCCEVDKEVKETEVNGKTLYQCCGKDESAWVKGSTTDSQTIQCCSADKKVITHATGIQGCCEKGALGYLFTDDSTELSCCEAGKEVKEIEQHGKKYRTCCNAGEDMFSIFKDGTVSNSPDAYFCCSSGREYVYPYDPASGNWTPEGGCCPEGETPQNTYEHEEWQYQMCCKTGLIAKEKNGKWECACPEDKPSLQSYQENDKTYHLCCEEGLSAVKQDDEWVCACPEDKPKHKTYKKDGNSYHVCCLEREETVRMGSTGAYMCCEKGLIAVEKEGEWICGCADGEIPVDNYANDGTISGKTCCEVKEDENTSFDEDIRKHVYHKKNYVVAGAVKGTCCGGYTSTEHRATIQTEVVYEDILTEEYNIFINGGVPYCANPSVSTETTDGTSVVSYTVSYPSVGSYSYTVVEDGGSWGIDCTAEKGDPQSGSCTEWTK